MFFANKENEKKEKKIMKELEKKDRYLIEDIARRINAKYGVPIQDGKTLLSLAVEEIRDILINEQAEVFINRLCLFYVIQQKKYGVDFSHGNQRVCYGDFNKLKIKPTKTFKLEFNKEANIENNNRKKQINEDIGFISLPTEKRKAKQEAAALKKARKEESEME